MKVRIEQHRLDKRVPLTISRGTFTGSDNPVLVVEHEGVLGRGEAAPWSPERHADVMADLTEWVELLEPRHPTERDVIESDLRPRARRPESLTAVDLALHDWLGRRTGMALWRLWGLNRGRIVPTSVTVGLDEPSRVAERVLEVISRVSTLKLKLGSPQGIEHDREVFEAARAAVGDRPVRWRVDANGGWDPDTARQMIAWLAERQVAYVEQPLPVELDDELPRLAGAALPVYLDESIETAADVVRLADSVQGVNLKLMKTGGLAEALRLIHTARACALGVMIGCMGESSLAISAGAQISPLVDHVDLDSHLNLRWDPFEGAELVEGRLLPTDEPGLGASPREAA